MPPTAYNLQAIRASLAVAVRPAHPALARAITHAEHDLWEEDGRLQYCLSVPESSVFLRPLLANMRHCQGLLEGILRAPVTLLVAEETVH